MYLYIVGNIVYDILNSSEYILRLVIVIIILRHSTGLIRWDPPPYIGLRTPIAPLPSGHPIALHLFIVLPLPVTLEEVLGSVVIIIIIGIIIRG